MLAGGDQKIAARAAVARLLGGERRRLRRGARALRPPETPAPLYGLCRCLARLQEDIHGSSWAVTFCRKLFL